MSDQFSGILAKSLDRILDELGEFGRRVRGGEQLRLPTITLHLKSGRDLRGQVVDVSRDGDGPPQILMHAPGDGRFAGVDVVHIPVNNIEAMTVHDVQRQDTPSVGASQAVKQELKRRVGVLESSLREVLGTQMIVRLANDAPNEREADALTTLEGLARVMLTDLARDPLGRAALTGRVNVVTLGAGASASAVSLADGVLTLVCPLDRSRRPSAAALRTAVESVL